MLFVIIYSERLDCQKVANDNFKLQKFMIEKIQRPSYLEDLRKMSNAELIKEYKRVLENIQSKAKMFETFDSAKKEQLKDKYSEAEKQDQILLEQVEQLMAEVWKDSTMLELLKNDAKKQISD